MGIAEPLTVLVMILVMPVNYQLNAGVENAIKRSRGMWRLRPVRLVLGD
jgi:hypothetical protein